MEVLAVGLGLAPTLKLGVGVIDGLPGREGNGVALAVVLPDGVLLGLAPMLKLAVPVEESEGVVLGVGVCDEDSLGSTQLTFTPIIQPSILLQQIHVPPEVQQQLFPDVQLGMHVATIIRVTASKQHKQKSGRISFFPCRRKVRGLF